MIEYFVRTGNPSYLGTKQENNFSQKLLNNEGDNFMVFEIEMDAQACNVSYIITNWGYLIPNWVYTYNW